jgi:hypothetical protein
MRIAFRIYDPSLSEHIYSGSTPMMLAGFFKFTAGLNTECGMQYQQFTGARDMLGYDIYEGDTVQIVGSESGQAIGDPFVARRFLTEDLGQGKQYRVL